MVTSSLHTTDTEVEFADDIQLVSTTDLKGDITYANPAFCQVAGYRLEEMLGQHHNLVRHPDMPKAAFADLWAHLQAGKPWRGMVKNRCKDGRYYWVDAYVTPIYEDGKMVGYQSVRCRPAAEHKARASKMYKTLKARETGSAIHMGLRQLTPAMMTIPLLLVSVISALWLLSPLQALWVIIPLLAAIWFNRHPLFLTPRFLQQLEQDYDSISRLIFSGDAPHSIADFHIKLGQAKIRTVLGRVDDTTASLNAMANDLRGSASLASQDISSQDTQIQQIATAVTQMASAAEEINRNIQDSNSQIEEARSHCITTSTQLSEAGEEMSALATQAEPGLPVSHRADERVRADRHHHERNSRHCGSNQPAGAQCLHRSRTGRRSGARLCSGGGRGSQPVDQNPQGDRADPEQHWPYPANPGGMERDDASQCDQNQRLPRHHPGKYRQPESGCGRDRQGL